MSIETISVIGLGYIGLPTAAILASKNIKVIGIDLNVHVVDTINRGEIHIVEPYLEGVVRTAVLSGHLRATTSPEPADAFLITVPTPFKDQHAPDLRFIENACASIAPVLKSGDLVILESTSPVGSTEQMAVWLAVARPDLSFPQTQGEASDIRIAYCPERVLPGRTLHELVENDRVIGGMTPKCSQSAVALYKIFVQGECVITNARTAEMCKLTENSFRDVGIAFANELSVICQRLGIDVWELIKLANRHPRVNILLPGPGVGGHCIAVDPWFIIDSAPEQARLIRAAREVNDDKSQWVIDQVNLAIGGYLQAHPEKTASGVVVGCFGLVFKADIDDLRESPALAITQALGEQHIGRVMAVEPNIDVLPDSLISIGTSLVSTKIALAEADIIVGLVAHHSFKEIPNTFLQGKVVVDTCGIWR
jgi:UDP-N-acetyl-D-mannosaminuronic acid dehydrogenase